MLYDDYIAYCSTYTQKYGERVVVLMEVGSFFEFYAVENDTIKEGANISDLCSLLNIQSTRKNKSIPDCSRANPLMAGFPSYSLPKFIDLLLADHYTIVLVEQTTPPPNPQRAVTQVISPATYLGASGVGGAASSYLMCVYITAVRSRGGRGGGGDVYVMSVAYMDLSTGETFLFDTERTGDHTFPNIELARLVSLYAPRELVLIGDGCSVLSLPLPPCCILRGAGQGAGPHLAPFQRPVYQNAVLKKVYPHTGLLTPIEYVQLEQRGDALTAFVYLIQFAYEHNEHIIAKLQRPRLVATQSHLRLTHSSAEQLYLLPKHGVPSSILQQLNTCDTAMGRRFFRDCLVHPLCDPVRIDERYRRSDAVRPHITPLRACLKGIKDLERLFRRIALRLAQPPEIAIWVSSLQAVDQLVGLIKGHGLGLEMPSIQPIVDHCTRRWDMTKLDTNADHFYQRGVYPEMDALADTVEAHHGMFQKIVDDANRVVGEPFFKLETTAERHDYQIIITKKRYETYVEKTSKTNTTGSGLPPVFTTQPVSASNKTVLKATFPKMDAIQHALHRHTSDLRALVHDHYLLDLDALHVFADAMQTAVAFVSAIDFHVTCAKNAHTFRYCRPTVESSPTASLRGAGLRHPLIEVVQTDLPYIANDIALGGDNPSGILLYGINAAGKSSYMKSVGLALIMAQAGMYVAADTFAFSPYDHIFTRIPGGDNLFKGQSTFVAEISELRTILNESTHRSLVIGDELASGTESVSAISIVAAGVKTLADRNASFIFATHLHEVAQLAIIKQLTNVAIFHISVHYDDARGVLVYDRLLKHGCGETLYGLEVCKSLDMPLAFMQLAHTIRKEHLHLSPTVVDTKVSRYSSEVFVDVCSVCHQRAEEVHHIQHQARADKDGFIGRIHKNDVHNLVALCQTCHDRVHSETVNMHGVAQTSAGKMLLVSGPNLVIDDTAMLKKKIEIKDGVRDAVQALRKQGKSYKAIADELKLTVYEVKKHCQNKSSL